MPLNASQQFIANAASTSRRIANDRQAVIDESIQIAVDSAIEQDKTFESLFSALSKAMSGSIAGYYFMFLAAVSRFTGIYGPIFLTVLGINTARSMITTGASALWQTGKSVFSGLRGFLGSIPLIGRLFKDEDAYFDGPLDSPSEFADFINTTLNVSLAEVPSMNTLLALPLAAPTPSSNPTSTTPSYLPSSTNIPNPWEYAYGYGTSAAPITNVGRPAQPTLTGNSTLDSVIGSVARGAAESIPWDSIFSSIGDVFGFTFTDEEEDGSYFDTVQLSSPMNAKRAVAGLTIIALAKGVPINTVRKLIASSNSPTGKLKDEYDDVRDEEAAYDIVRDEEDAR